MSLLIVLYLVLVVALPLVLSAAVSYRTLPSGRQCPLCGDETVRMLRRWLHLFSVIERGGSLHRRWCMGCGWEGTSRIPHDASARVKPDRQPSEPGVTEDHRNGAAEAGDDSGNAIDLREIQVDGDEWRVLLRTWCDTERWYGRLMFSGPSGRLWEDRNETFSGPSPLDVLGQALSLPDRVLTWRLREMISNA